MVRKIMPRRDKKQKGIALVTVLMFATVVLIITGTVYARLTFASKQITLRDNLDQQNALTDAALSDIIDWMNKQNYNDTVIPPNINTYKDGITFVADLYKDGTVNENFQLNPSTTVTDGAPSLKVTAKATAYVDPAMPATTLYPYDYTKNYFLYGFMISINRISTVISTDTYGGIKALTPVLSPGTPSSVINWDPVKLSEKLYREFTVSNGKFSEVVRVSILPLTTNISNMSEILLHGGAGNLDRKQVRDHMDIYKLVATSCVPDCNDATVKVKRKYELIVQRPVLTSSGLSFNQAVYANGNVDIKNATTNSGPTFIDSTNEGDVFSNDNIAIGPNGKIGGKVDSAKLVYFGTQNNPPPDSTYSNAVPDLGIPATGHALSTTTQIVDKANSKSNVARIEPPQVNYKPLPTTACVTTLPILKDCVITGDYMQNSTQQFQGTVYITGNYSQKGDFLATGTDPVHMVVDGKITIGGNSKLSTSPNTQEVIFISNYESPAGTDPQSDPAIKVAGNPGTGTTTGAVFYTSKQRSDVQIRGSAQVFGAIVANGTVEFDGSMTMKRDTDLAALSASLYPSADQCKLQIVSWQEIKNAS
jgi:hypothetical protein